MGKLDNSMSKLEQAKLTDAITKLADYRGKVISLATSEHMGLADADMLAAGADAATRCIQGI